MLFRISSVPTHYSLRVVRAQDVYWEPTFHSQVPELYIKVTFGDLQRKTRIIRENLSPTWNEQLILPIPDGSKDKLLAVELKHNSSWGRNTSIGTAHVSLGDLVDRSTEGEVMLALHTSHSSRVTGIVFVRLEVTDEQKAAESGIKSAAKDIDQIGFSSAAIAPVVSAVGELRSQCSEKKDLVSSLEDLVCKAQAVKELVDKLAGFHPYVNAAWQVASLLYEAVKKQAEYDDKVVDLVHEMEKVYDIIKDTDSVADKLKSLSSPISEFFKQSTECCLFIREYTRPSFARRMMKMGNNEKIDGFRERFIDIRKSLDSGVGLQTQFISARILEIVDNIYLKQQLEPTRMDASTRPKCLPGTRAEFMTEIMDWMFSDTKPNIFWLHGVAGSGKSTISMTIAEYLLGMQRRGAYLFFERGKSDDANAVIRTLAYWLASFDHVVAEHVRDAVKANNGISSASLDFQFEKLVFEPLEAAAKSMQGPVAIVLDALDECPPGDVRQSLLMLIKEKFPKLPATFRFLITSRMEPDIKRALSVLSIRVLELEFSSTTSHNDVARYIDHEMQAIFRDAELAIESASWKADMDILGKTANGLFIWASTAVKVVSSQETDPLGALNDLLSYCRSRDSASHLAPGFGLCDLYDTVMKSSRISWSDKRCSQVLGLILLSKVPISVTQIDYTLRCSKTWSSRLVIERLQSVLVYTPGNLDVPVRLFHASFYDYLMSPERRGPWFVDVPSQQLFLANWCLDVMAKDLRFNICDLESSFMRNDDVPDIGHRIKGKISPYLEYSCRLWAEHLRGVPYSLELVDVLKKLEEFAKCRLLHWLEVLSLTGHSARVAGRALLDATLWTAKNHSDLSSFFWDAYRLASIFSLPISQSVPHIYLSALSLSRGESIVSDHYSITGPVISVDRFGSKPATPCMKVFRAHDDEVYSVAVSPDGKRVVSGSDDRTIRVWDAESGELISGPFEGHTDWVRSVAFAPDGGRVVSGSSDKTIRVWDTESGELLSGPFRGHTGAVWSVAFSPDGRRVVSGSSDKTIRVWDAESGELVSEPFEGHACAVWSVAFSPDGKRVVSGSDDQAICVWDAESGGLVSGPFEGHADCVRSVAFSPDGERVVSGSSDKMIRVWDAESGGLVSGPFKGHTGAVWSVAFSSHGKRVVSGSSDKTIRVWDAESGELVSGPFEGHTGAVWSVVFSPDGKRAVSGSDDQTIRVWDAESVQPVSRPFEGHTKWVRSVAFSLDGKRVVSGSSDKTIRVWDAESGELVSGPFKGHTGAVWSVAFSPDGKRVVSGSSDKMIRVWDAERGVLVSGPFKRHTGAVWSVAFSPDGKRVVSGSSDTTICVWDAESGELVSGPFKGHTDWVRSVAFSPDDRRMVSGSNDRTIRVWDLESGALVSGPFKGHTDWIRSVAFSSDGKRVVSGSSDKTIRVWDAETGELVSGPFKRHTGAVWSVAFSADGRRVVSGSSDQTICVWDAESGGLVSGPFEGHACAVWSVAFSPDGRRVVSGSDDMTIRMWSLEGGQVNPTTLVADARGFESETNQLCNTRIALSSEDEPSSKREVMPDVVTRIGRFSNWSMSGDGWIVGEQGKYLLWIPPDTRRTLWRPSNTALFSCRFSTRLDFTDCIIGEGWDKAHKSSR